MEILSENPDWLCAIKPNNCTTQVFVQTLKSILVETKFACIYDLDENVAGPVLLAKNINARNFLKNAYGSNCFKFTFYAYGSCHKLSPNHWECDLSIAWDEQKKRSYPSKQTGKKASTHFTIEKVYGNYVYVKCVTHYLRKQQISIHSHFSYFDILGDNLWNAHPQFIYLENLKNIVKKPSYAPIFSNLHLLLTQVEFEFQGQPISISYPLPKNWQLIEKVLTNYCKTSQSQ